MSTHPSIHHANASHSAAHAIAHARNAPKAHAASADDDGDGGGFAAQLLRAQPDQDAKPADTDAAKADANKTSKDDADKDGKDDKSAKTADAAAPAVDPNAPPPWPPQAAPTTSLAAKPDADADGAADPFAALRKGKGAKDVGLAALGLGKDAGKDTKASDAAALQGKGSKSAADFTAQLGKGEGAGNGATGTADAMSALLPQADPVVAVQAGAVGASPNALLDNNAAANQPAPTPPAQATLPMTPQSPTFAPALGQQIAVWMKDGIQHAEVQLSPMDLGPIRVKIEMAGAQTRVEMAADVQSTRDALQQALPQLADSLGQVGLSLSGGGVSDQSTAQQQQAQTQAAFADARGTGGSGGRAGATHSRGGVGDVGGEDFAAASAARQVAQRRGLLDMYV